jgi:hypothetical protein
MTYIQEMAAALRLAKGWMPKTPHGEIVRKRIRLAIEAYELHHPRADQPTFTNRLMR